MQALETALYVLTVCGALIALQLVILTVEIVALRRDMIVVLRMLNALNNAINPWAAEDEPTNPDIRPRRRRRWSFWIPLNRKE